MSTSSRRSRGVNHRVNSLQNDNQLSREPSRSRKYVVTHNEAYSYALRVAYLSYLLQPRARRTKHIPGPQQQISRSSTSFNDLMKDFSIVRDSKSTRFPHGFVSELEKRLTSVLMGKEKRQEYQDALVKRTFAAFFNAFTEQSFKKRMEKDRRVEDLVLIFFSNATKELQKGKAPGDDGWRLMVDRHVALFVRLVGLILKDHDWAKDRPDLTTRLATLETKLLAHDRDLADASLTGGTTVEEIVPLSYEVKDMPLVQIVARIFGLTNTMAQSDITKNKPIWTEKAALQDLKTYQSYLNLNTKRTLQSDDFDLEESYESWKRAEGPDLSQMMLAIMQSNPELAKSTPGGQLPQFNGHQANGSTASESSYAEMARKLSDPNVMGSYVIDQPVDISSLIMNDDGPSRSEDGENPFTFVPPDPRAFYRLIMSEALAHDLRDQSLEPSEATSDTPAIKLLSKQTTELLNEICVRWRIPYFSRIVLFLDVVKEKFVHQEIGLETLDGAFIFVKDPPVDNKKGPSLMSSALLDRHKWTVADYALMQQILSSLFDALLRELYNTMLHCYDAKPLPAGMVLHVMKAHIEEDPNFSKNREQVEKFRGQLRKGLQQRALDIYKDFVEKEVPQEEETWEFFHVIQLGTAVKKIAERIQKRYRRNPEVEGVNPLMVLVETMMPIYGEDARDLVSRIIQQAKEKDQEVPTQDGFALYAELVEIRRIHMDALPGIPFAFNVEALLADFVWRFIHNSDEKLVGMVEEALKGDQFIIRKDNDTVDLPDEKRHSYSIISVFQAFNQILREVLNLNWDDDLQYAKFMTALARSYGTGLARYCELVEQRFTREMDRLTPEQEAAVNQTRQEKWVQLAKDAWNNKEKIEPFQFFPESFVKLNNIAFAIHDLDKLEREMNVDACAEVIRKNTPVAQQRPRAAQNYVFTIKIVEAEDLKACDINGLSDPYVVLADEYQKRLAKTRIIYANLNPRWDDTIDITTQGPLNIIATIWDWDTLGDHDYVGRTSIKLDPAHFKDFLPREYWLDLDTQGRLLLRVSMEGERDDIQFYFGKAFRTLKRTERDMTRKITDKLSSFISHCLSHRALRSLLQKGLTMSSVSNYFNRNRTQPTTYVPSEAEIANALKPLFAYFDDNFAIMNHTLTSEAMIMVMTRLWKEVLVTIEGLLVPPLSDKPSQQRPLTQQELDVVFKWLQMLFDFFHAVDEETGAANGVPTNVLKSPKYHEICSLNFFYFDTTDNLIRTSERMASATAAKQQSQRNRLSAPPALGTFSGAGGLLGMPSTRRAKSIMLSRNLGTMKKAKEEKWREAQADPNDDMILRILRMRPDAERYLKDRTRQKERLAAAAAAEMIVRQSLVQGGGGRMASNLARR